MRGMKYFIVTSPSEFFLRNVLVIGRKRNGQLARDNEFVIDEIA